MVLEFSNGGVAKLETFLPKNWCIDKLSKIGHHLLNKVILELILPKNVKNKECAP